MMRTLVVAARQTLGRGVQLGLVGLVQAYRLFLSPWLGSQCRFTPTCSAYALDALQAHGAGVGAYLAARRIVRCRPGCPGGHDPVPSMRPKLFPFFQSKTGSSST